MENRIPAMASALGVRKGPVLRHRMPIYSGLGEGSLGVGRTEHPLGLPATGEVGSIDDRFGYTRIELSS
jgi:hypothetical protein